MRRKTIIHAGRGPELDFSTGARITFHYKAETLLVSQERGIEVGSEIEDSRKSYPDGYGAPMELVFGKQFQLPVWELSLATMRLGEVATFDVDPPDLISYPGVSKKLRDIAHRRDDPNHEHTEHQHHCFGMAAEVGLGYPALDALVKEPHPIRFTFELISYEAPGSYEADGWQLGADEKLASVQSLRERGKAHFAAGRLSEAAESWKEGLGRLDQLQLREKPGEPEWDALDAQKIPLYLNLAQAWISSGEPYSAIEAATEVLSRDPSSEKGLWRRAKARIAAWDLDAARADLAAFAKAHPKLAHLATKELAAIAVLEHESKAKDVYRQMMSKT